MYQTFQIVLKYLEDLNKIILDRDGKIRIGKVIKIGRKWLTVKVPLQRKGKRVKQERIIGQQMRKTGVKPIKW